MKRMVREPLLHFLLLGAALFVVFAFLRDNGAPSRDQIVVSAGKIEHLATLFARTWQRSATREELEGLVNDFIREEAAYREGLALGLARDDTIIRRRIRQKLDFIAEDLASQVEPTEADLTGVPGRASGGLSHRSAAVVPPGVCESRAAPQRS